MQKWLERFNWYLNDGYGVHKICNKLKEEKYEIKKPKNKKNKYNWGASTIRDLLKNEKYAGDLKQRKTYTVDFLEHKKKKNKGEVEFIYIKNHHTPIIDRETFDAVQIEMARRSKECGVDKVNYSNKHDLSGKIVCGKCDNFTKKDCRIKRKWCFTPRYGSPAQGIKQYRLFFIAQYSWRKSIIRAQGDTHLLNRKTVSIFYFDRINP